MSNCTVSSQTQTTYKFKDESTLIITRKFKDTLHPTNAGVQNRDLVVVSVSGNVSETNKKEVSKWIYNGCRLPVPNIIKKYLEESK